ncbi:hypothetical protein YC2023_120157 [Brassica napus]
MAPKLNGQVWGNACIRDADDEPTADNADDGSRYFNLEWSEGEIGPNYWENVINGEDFQRRLMERNP